MRLFIAEKPSMAREIAACLKNPKKGDGYIKTDDGVVTWLFGHVLRQVEPDAYDAKYKIWRLEDLPIIPAVWKMEVDPKAAAQFNIVKNLVSKADVIVHAGDPDREGQLLVDEVLDFIGNKKPVKRILLNALDRDSIIYALSHLDDNKNFFNLKQSALARSRADWLIGMNLSRAYTLAAQNAGHKKLVLPIGRVKTPTLALVVRREREIQNFKPVDFYKIHAQFQHANGMFTAIWRPNEEFIKSINPTAIDSEGRLVNKKAVAYFLKKFSEMPHDAEITKLESAKRKESPPLPFSLSALQIAAGKIFGYTPQQVLDAAQSLYEKKFTTYPRSDCQYLPLNQFHAATKILAHLQNTDDEILKRLVDNADAKIKSRAWNDKKISAHHAIIPTVKPLGEVTQIELNVYNLIAKNYAVQFHKLHLYDETTVTVTYKDEIFSVTSKMVTQNGWRDFYTMPKVVKEDEVAETLPKMKQGDKVTYENAEVKISTTQKPARFTPSTLVQGMKEIHKFVKDPDLKVKLKDVYGIGTEATRAAIIDDLIKRNFLVTARDKKKTLTPTEKAFLLIDALPDALTYPDATAIWEDKLYLMSDGKGTLDEFLSGQAKFTGELCADALNAKFKAPTGLYKCPRCQKGVMVQRNGRNGVFWGCSRYPACNMTCNDLKGKPALEEKMFRQR
ncbi:MAG: DNA topoisomerase 3 [Selenomonadaceae bacterium]|nr:DNA topoisomerase 3 [Selenomonadaceae bacterium]